MIKQEEQLLQEHTRPDFAKSTSTFVFDENDHHHNSTTAIVVNALKQAEAELDGHMDEDYSTASTVSSTLYSSARSGGVLEDYHDADQHKKHMFYSYSVSDADIYLDTLQQDLVQAEKHFLIDKNDTAAAADFLIEGGHTTCMSLQELEGEPSNPSITSGEAARAKFQQSRTNSCIIRLESKNNVVSVEVDCNKEEDTSLSDPATALAELSFVKEMSYNKPFDDTSPASVIPEKSTEQEAERNMPMAVYELKTAKRSWLVKIFAPWKK